MINQQSPPIPVPHFDGDRLSETTVLPSDIYRSFKRNLPLSTSSMPDEITKAILCQANCSGNGECRDGSCYCMVRTTINYMNYKFLIKVGVKNSVNKLYDIFRSDMMVMIVDN